ncbi:MAG: sulfatase-like hydrolase/transferase [Bradymonadia bacterium]
MRAVSHISLPPALAALALVLVEWIRTLMTSATELGGFGGSLTLCATILGILGLPLWGLGLVSSLSWRGIAFGWRWGGAGRPASSPARKVAWVIFAVLALTVLIMVVQVFTVTWVKSFKRHFYQGLASGLTAAVVVCVLAALAGPIVGALTRLVRWLSPKLPRAVDPTTLKGAAIWVSTCVVLGAFLAPVLIKQLHTVDMRPARMALLWIGLLFAAHGLVRWRPEVGKPAFAVAVTTPLIMIACMLWAAGALGDVPGRALAVERDTLLTGPMTRRLRKMYDGDGDGVSQAFAGGDCNDADPKVRTGVYDVPGDGIDQNCTGADLVLAEDPLLESPRVAPVRPRQNWNVLILTIDALRADMIDTEMPNLKALAEGEAVHYTDAYSAGASTYWSVAALMTSNMPSRIQMGGDQTPINQERLLTEELRAGGWHTALFANVTVFFVRNLRQAIDVADYNTSKFTTHGATPGSTHLTDGVLKHLERWQAKKVRNPADRFYLWAHYYDPHDPYFEVPNFPAEDSSDEARYRAICRYVDDELGRLIKELKARGLYDNTLLVITADHGDEFLEHGHRFHGSTLYEEMVHVPLIMKVPGVPQRTLTTPIGHIEVAPTILDLMGMKIPQDFLGRTRAEEILTGEAAPVAPVWFEVLPDQNYTGHQVGLRLGDLKLIYRINSNTFELYDLKADPSERVNLFDWSQHEKMAKQLLRYADHQLYAIGQGWSRATKPPGAPKRGAKRRRPPPWKR